MQITLSLLFDDVCMRDDVCVCHGSQIKWRLATYFTYFRIYFIYLFSNFDISTLLANLKGYSSLQLHKGIIVYDIDICMVSAIAKQ